MKKLLLATSTLVFAGSALAADLPPRMAVKAPVVAPVAYSWTGCFVGGHVGAGWSRTGWSEPYVPAGAFPVLAPTGSSFNTNGDAGVLGGVQAGCDYQFAGNWVIGIGGDFSWADIRDSGIDPFFAGKNGGPMTVNSRTDQMATLTGRIGYSFDRVLVYAKGGGAWAHDKYDLQNLFAMYGGFCAAPGFVACNPTGSTDRFGWTAGVGVEWAFAQNWTLFGEYAHYGFNNKSVTFTDPNNSNNPLTVFAIKKDIDVVKVGINYRFWSAAPVVARY
jgi:outer membrane immunogenic protein